MALVLPTDSTYIDLGVYVDSTLSFTPRVNYIVSKAKQRASQILRCFLSGDHSTLCKAFVVYARPML